MKAGAAGKPYLLQLKPDQLAAGHAPARDDDHAAQGRRSQAGDEPQRRQVRHAPVGRSVADDRGHRPATARRQPHGDQERDVPVPAALARGLATGKPASSLRIGLPGRKRVKVALKAGKGTIAGGATSVRVKGRSVTVSGLPAATGIVEVTLYQPRAPKGPALLGRGHKATVTARVVTTKSQNLKYVIAGKR